MPAAGNSRNAATDAVVVRALNGTVHPFAIGFFRVLFDERIALTTLCGGGGLTCCAALIAARSGKPTSA